MTATQPATPVCPNCGSTNTMILSDGMARCFDDQHEWDPDNVTALPRPALEPFGMAPVEDVYGPEVDAAPEPAPAADEPVHDLAWALEAGDPETYQERITELYGGTARLEGGQVAQVVGFPDDDHVNVVMNDGELVTVALSDVERITPRAPEQVIDAEPAGDVAVPEWALDVEALSNLIMRAGLAAIEDRDGAAVVGDPPADWLPRDESTNALVEAASALAVARLVVAYDIDRADMTEYLDRQTAPAQGDTTTEVASDDSSSHDDAGNAGPDQPAT